MSACAVYSYTPKLASSSSGSSSPSTTSDPIAAQLASGFALDLGSVVAGPTLADDFGGVAATCDSIVDCGSVPALAIRSPSSLQAARPLDLGQDDDLPGRFRRLRLGRGPCHRYHQPGGSALSEQLQLRRGTASQVAAFTPPTRRTRGRHAPSTSSISATDRPQAAGRSPWRNERASAAPATPRSLQTESSPIRRFPRRDRHAPRGGEFPGRRAAPDH